MTISRALRLLLGFAATLIVVWAFFDVARRALAQHHAERERPITLTVLHWGDAEEDKIVDALVSNYQGEHPRIHVERINPGTADYESKLKTMMAAGTPPDVFYLRPEWLADFATLKLIAPVADRFAREPAAWKSDFFPLLIDAFRYNLNTGLVGAGGTLYGLPKDFTPAVFYVNTDLFKKAGIPVPYQGWTWDEFEQDMRKIHALSATSPSPVYGSFLTIWPDTLRAIIWTFGGDFFGPGGFRDVALDSPACQAALQMIVRMRITEGTVYNPTGIAKEGGQEFFNGNIGCIGPVGRWFTPSYNSITKFNWDIVPLPHKFKPASTLFYTAWTISSQTRYPEESWELTKYLCSRQGQIDQARLGLAVPCLQSVANSPDFLSPPGLLKKNAQVFLDAFKYSRLQQNPREPEWTRILSDKISKSLSLGQESTMESAAAIKAAWLAELDSPLRRKAWSPMNWSAILGITAGGLVTLICALWWRARREKLGPIDRAQERAGWTFIAPWLIGFLLLALGPMLASLLLSFSRWSAMVPLKSAESVGTANYHQIFHDSAFYQSIRVTIYFVIIAVPIGQMAALAVALLMNLRIRFITFFRTIYFVPSVVGGAAAAVMWLQIFNKDYGLLNKILWPIARLLHTHPPDWFGLDAKIWGVPAFVIMGLWGVGGGMIIYLAGLKGIPASLYEAATIDGAGLFRKFWNVTLPMLSPLLFYNLVMGIIGSFQVFTQAYIMTGPGPDNATLFYVLNLYMQAFEFHNMGYASALAWILFVMILGLTMLVFAGSKKLVYYEGLRN